MLENERKGWYGNFSATGKYSCEKYNIIINEKKITENLNKKVKIYDVFTPDEPKTSDIIEEHMDILNKYLEEDKLLDYILNSKKNKDKKTKIVDCKEKLNIHSQKYKYHNIHCCSNTKKKKILCDPGCTRYHPKYTLVWPRMMTGLNWAEIQGRKQKKKEIDKRDFFINDLDKNDIKCLVNMDKTTQRGDFGQTSDLRIRTVKPFSKIKSKNLKYGLHRFLSKEKKIKFYKKKNKNLDIKNFLTQSKSEFLKTKNNFHKKKKFKEFKTPLNKNYKNTPDFSKSLSREQREKPKMKKINAIPFISPNYSLVRERPLIMTVYKKQTKSRNRVKTFQGMDPSFYFDPDKIISNFNNHNNPKTPLFKNMTSRTNKINCKLPLYMQKIYNRNSVNDVNDKSLELNLFSDGKFMAATNTFFPKTSFNKMINANFATSLKFRHKETDEDLEKKKSRVRSNLSLLNVEYQELKDEGKLDKFDNFCYRTVLRKRKQTDINKLILNFEDDES